MNSNIAGNLPDTREICFDFFVLYLFIFLQNTKLMRATQGREFLNVIVA